MTVRRFTLAIEDSSVDAVDAAVHEPQQVAGRTVLLAPGAGGSLDGDGLAALAEVLAELGHPVVRVNLPHHQQGRRAAPRADRSIPAFTSIVHAARREIDADDAWILGGKSYGGRVASMAVAEGLDAAGLLFYGYPLHPPGKPERPRIDHWPSVPVPCLFLQGDHDTFCDLDLLDAYIRKFPRRATVHVVEGGDHSLHITAARSPDAIPSSPPRTIRGLKSVLQAWIPSLDD